MGSAPFKLSEPQEYILTSPQEINLFLAGVGSGKTHLAGVISGNFIQNFPKVRGFIGANTYNQLNTSTMFRIRETWKEIFGWEADRDYVVGKKPPKGFSTEGHNFDRYDGIVSFVNGTVVFIGSLDNAMAHSGKEFAWAILDETKDTKEGDVREVIMGRMRQSGMYLDETTWRLNDTAGRAFNPLYILTSPAKVQWLNEWFGLDEYRAEIESTIYSKDNFFSKEKPGKCVAISSTYHNSANLPAGYIERILENNPSERAKALIFANPFTKTGGEFYSGFSAERHVGRVEFKPDLPVHITFDQNVVPYITACLWQVDQSDDGWNLRNFAEFCLPNPNNTSERLCDSIIAKYGDAMKTVFLYGDAYGHSGSTKSRETDYQIVERVLRSWLNNGSDRTCHRNPPVIKRRDFINNVFEGKTRWKILIDEDCKNSVIDLTYVKQDPNGHKWKEKAKDEISGQTYEKYGHCFSGDTMITTSEGQRRIDEVRPGEMVLTRAGYRTVVKAFNNGIRAVRDFEINGTLITCTPDHLFYSGGGFIPVESMEIGQTICIFDENTNQICKKKLLSFRVLNSADTPNQRTQATGFIFRGGRLSAGSGKKLGFTNTSGFYTMAQYLKGITSTIRTKIRLIIQLITLNVNWASIILVNTRRLNGLKTGLQNSKTSMRLRDQWQASGTDQRREGIGTESTPPILSKPICVILPVSNAEELGEAGYCERISARPNAKADMGQGHFGRKERVYDLQVEGEHEYFANGILVHNCSDAMDYFITSIAENDFERFCNQ